MTIGVINVSHLQMKSPITSLTWGHNDRRLFIATGCQIHVAWVSPRRMASLQHLARLRLRLCLSEAEQLDTIGMPRLLRDVVMAPLFSSTIHVRQKIFHVSRYLIFGFLWWCSNRDCYIIYLRACYVYTISRPMDNNKCPIWCIWSWCMGYRKREEKGYVSFDGGRVEFLGYRPVGTN